MFGGECVVDKALFTSTHGEWETPKELFKLLDDEFSFQLDPCCTRENALCSFYYPKDGDCDGLALPWFGLCVYVNPPYGEPEYPCKKNCKKIICVERGYHIHEYVPGVIDWTQKCVEEAKKGAVVVALLPVRSDTKFWSRDVWQAYEWRFVEGRLRFNLNGKPVTTAPFPSIVVVWDFEKKAEMGLLAPWPSILHNPSPRRAKAQGVMSGRMLMNAGSGKIKPAGCEIDHMEAVTTVP